jgi:hypothetical protein
MIPVETVLGIWGEGIKKNGGGLNSSMICLIYCKNFCKCHSVPPPSTAKKKKKKRVTEKLKKKRIQQ